MVVYPNPSQTRCTQQPLLFFRHQNPTSLSIADSCLYIHRCSHAMASQLPTGIQATDPSEAENSTATRSRVAFPHIEPAAARQDPAPANVGEPGKRKRKNRASKKRRNRRQSFAAPPEIDAGGMVQERPSLIDPTATSSVARDSFYRLQAGNRSNTSLESEALLDHRYLKHISF